MNFDEAPAWLQAADNHAIASDNTSIFEDIGDSLGRAPQFLGVSLASGLNSFWNSGVAVGNVFRDEHDQMEYNDTADWISSYDEDYGKYYRENQESADLAGFVVTSFVPGIGAVKGLQAAQKAAQVAAAGRVGGGFARATKLFAPSMESYVQREAADLATKRASFSFLHQNSLKALGSEAAQWTLEGAAFEIGVMATMFKSPILEEMDAGDLASNFFMSTLGFGGGLGAIAGAAKTYFGVGKLLKSADIRAKPFISETGVTSGAALLPSDKAAMALMDIQRLENLPATADYVLANKRAAGETGESLLPNVVEAEVNSLNSRRLDNIQVLRNTVRTEMAKTVANDEGLGQLVTNMMDAMSPDDALKFVFQAKQISRAGDKTPLDIAAKELVQQKLAKTLGKARKDLSGEMQDFHIRLTQGKPGEIVIGKPGYLHVADVMNGNQIDNLMAKNKGWYKEKMDFRQAVEPRAAQVRWMAARRTQGFFPKGYVFGSHDLPALEHAIKLGLDEITVDLGDGATRVLKTTDEIRDYNIQAKAEVVQAQIEHKRKSDMIEAISDVRKDFIEGTISKKNPAAVDAELSFHATRSYRDEFAKAIGKPADEIKLTDFDKMPRFAKVTYDTRKVEVDGMEVQGMALIKEREKLAKASVLNYFASYAGQYHELFPEVPEDILRSAWRGEGGAGLLTNAGGAYGSMASMASYLGGLVSELSKARLGGLTEDITQFAQPLLERADEAVELAAVNALVANTPELYVLNDALDNLIPYKLRQWMDKNNVSTESYLNGNYIGRVEFDPPELDGPDLIPLKSEGTRAAVAKRIALADARNAKWKDLHALQGNTDEKLPGVFRPFRPDPRDYKHVAFVKDPTIVGAGHTKMIFAKDAASLESMVADVEALGHYKVFTRQQTEDFRKAMGEWEFDKTLHENYIDSDLKSRGIATNFFPATDPQKVVNQWLQDEVRAENALLKQSVLVRYEKEFNELKRLAADWDKFRGSRVGTRTLDEILSSGSDGNPYVGMMKSMLNITRIEDMPVFIRTANEALDATVSRAWNSATDVLDSLRGKTPNDADVEKVNKIFEEVGFKTAYSTTALQLANQNVPRGVLSNFVRTANAFLTTTMLRMDPFNAITNLVGHSIMMAPELKSVLRDIKAGNAAGAGELAKLANIKVPGTGDEVFSASKLIANAYKRLHGPDGEALRAEYKKRGLVPDLTDQYFKSLDPMTLTGKETVQDMVSKTAKLKQAFVEFGNKAERWTGNRMVEELNRLAAVDVMKQLTEIAVKQGIMDEKASWMYVNTFNNRVNGVIRAAERPLMFQGPIGQAMGLFQSYQMNLMQQLFRNIGEGRTKTIAMMGGLQASIFGASSLPGFSLINNSLIADAAGNPEHKELYSTTAAIFGQTGADWLMYGAPSNILRASLYTRGDTNPRTWHVVPNPTNPSEIPFISAFAKAAGSIKGALTQVADGENVWNGFLSGIEHMGISRPLAGFAAVARAATSEGAQVISTQRNGAIAGSNDLFTWASLVRLAGAKPIDEAIVTNNYYRINAYAEKDRLKREELGVDIKNALLGGGEVSDEAVENFAQKYAEYGGKQTQFNRFFMGQFKDATFTQSEQMVEKLDNPYARRMQEVIGGRLSLFNTDDY